MTDPEALEAIRNTWIAWALKQIDDVEAMAQVAEALEESGRPLFRAVDSAGDEGK